MTMRAPAVARRAAGMQVVAKVKDAAAPARYEAVFLMKPGVEDSVRAAEVDKLGPCSGWWRHGVRGD